MSSRLTSVSLHPFFDVGARYTSHSFGRSRILHGPGGVPNGGGMYTPAAMASSIRLRKRRRRMKERRTIAAETKSSRKRVARNVNLVDVKSESPDEDMARACTTQTQARVVQMRLRLQSAREAVVCGCECGAIINR